MDDRFVRDAAGASPSSKKHNHQLRNRVI